jgi:hypothetical protein
MGYKDADKAERKSKDFKGKTRRRKMKFKDVPTGG